MLVKAKWNVKGSDGWHIGGEVFNTEEDFGDAVEVLDAPAVPKKEPEPVKEPAKEEPKAEKPKTSTRRRTTAK
jgi:hypothetical protein